MKMQKMKFGNAIKCTFFVSILLMIIFAMSTFLWIIITPFEMKDFSYVLSLLLKNAGSYSTLLVGIAITVFYQIYSKEKELEQEDKIKINEVGYYTLAFPLENDNYSEEYCGDKIVVEINEEKDFQFSPFIEDNSHFHVLIKFLTSKKESTNLKNIMAFGEDFFRKNEKDILENYYQYCEKVTYSSPLYCSTKPTGELENNEKADRNRYFWLVLKGNKSEDVVTKNFWVSAVTEEGILMFVKAKVKLENAQKSVHISLLQQTTYYKSRNKLCALYR